MVDLSQYYFGIITRREDYYKNPMKVIRYLNGISYDPFNFTELKEATTLGTPTILFKENDIFYDIENNRYNHELPYTIGKYNYLGIRLEHVEPFTDWYENLLWMPIYPVIAGIPLTKEGYELRQKMPYSVNWIAEENHFTFDLWDLNGINDFYEHYILDHFEYNFEKQVYIKKKYKT